MMVDGLNTPLATKKNKYSIFLRNVLFSFVFFLPSPG